MGLVCTRVVVPGCTKLGELCNNCMVFCWSVCGTYCLEGGHSGGGGSDC